MEELQTKMVKYNCVKAKTCGIYDCLNNMVIDFQLTPYNTSEKELSIKNIENTMKFFKDQKLCILFDTAVNLRFFVVDYLVWFFFIFLLLCFLFLRLFFLCILFLLLVVWMFCLC